MKPIILAVAISTAFAFATPAPVVLAMDAGALTGDSNTKRSCDTLVRNINRTKKKIESEDYKLAELQIEEQDATGEELKRIQTKITIQKYKIEDLKGDLRQWQRELAKNC